MQHKIWKGLLATTLLSLMPLHVAEAASANMVVRGTTNPPIGHYQFCRQFPSECAVEGDDPGPVQLTEALWKSIVHVNVNVNQAVQPFTDKEIYGVEEKWAYPRDVGDCEDYALLKRKLLIKAGIHPGNLLLTVALQPNGDGHAVLTVRTDRGDFVLDNMRNKVMLWSQTEYNYLKRQSSTDAARWLKIQDGSATAYSSIE